MQTRLADFIKNSPQGQEADVILRSCVHCGFCLATCPTYQLLGDELDSPRGRIYLMKQMLEGQPVTQKTQLHLDRCLTCRACESTCPSGVRYAELVDISRDLIERQVKRSADKRLIRYLLRKVLPNPLLFKPIVKIGQALRPVLPGLLKKKVPAAVKSNNLWPESRHSRKMLVLDGCVQPTLSPNINLATAHVLDALGISLIKSPQAGCCGAIAYHLNAQEEGMDAVRKNIDAWWSFIEGNEIEAIAMTASGCGVTVKEYGHMLRHDPAYAEKAAKVSSMTKDISEILVLELENLQQILNRKKINSAPNKLAFHSPCTLQHGQQVRGHVEKILQAAGFELATVSDAHLCCGSAGTYSILQPILSRQLLKNKISALEAEQPEQIVTANIGCLLHLQNGTDLPVRHWIEILNAQMSSVNV
ncbi:glycolate oxidase iron-sulfur subunit [Nitrosomonas aestuarii]|uniref:Glycolate oxidase iron-sulfur subunit n=1 Tax=Nitrosomonas aestuarii TaxID=52441 RepID=A0A1I3X3X1_9PROT|nr:glycolate oxidase subunit GlcF [Nitrosomonas aestuarii]SFK13947.1 glycolate oxidase iron-sulfur subunit [Nitrosomonas aestuarii]